MDQSSSPVVDQDIVFFSDDGVPVFGLCKGDRRCSIWQRNLAGKGRFGCGILKANENQSNQDRYSCDHRQGQNGHKTFQKCQMRNRMIPVLRVVHVRIQA